MTTNFSETKVKWSKYVGFAGIGYHNTGSLLAPTGAEGDCFSYNTKSSPDTSSIQYLWKLNAFNYNPYCDVCQSEIAQGIANSNNVSGTHDLWIGYPEISTSHPSNFTRLYNMETYRIAGYWYTSSYDGSTYNSELYQKGNGKQVELRSVVQNLNASKDRKLKLVMTTTDSSGITTKQTTSGSFVVPAYATGDSDLPARDRNSCMSLSIKLQLNSDYVYGDKILGQLIDEETNTVLSTTDDLFNAQSNTEIKTRYVDKATNSEITNAHTSIINLPSQTTMTVTHPSRIQGYAFDSVSTQTIKTDKVNRGQVGTSQTVTYYFTQSDDPAPNPDPEPEPESCKHNSSYTSIVTKAATCTSTGLENHKCNSCQKIFKTGVEIPINSSNHVNKRSVAAKSATCLEEGWEAYEVCDDCGAETIQKKVVAKLSEHTWGEWKSEVAPTCESDGVARSRTCTVCGTTEGGESIAKLGHDYHSNNDGVEPTCNTPGREASKTCSHENCPNKTVLGAVIPATGLHKEVLDLTTARESTCSAAGKNPDTVCSICGETIKVGASRELAAHKIEEVAGSAIEPTCTTDGKGADKECSVCHGTDTKVIGASIHSLGHNYVDGKCSRCGLDQPTEVCDHKNKEQKIIQEPTCTDTGSARTWCNDCHTWLDEPFEIPARGHNFEVVEGKAATCTESGYSSYQRCIVCSFETGKQEIAALGHNYGDDNLCIRCKEKNPGAVKITLSPTNTSDEVTFDKTEYAPGESANVTIKGKKVDGSFRLPSAIKVNGVTVQTSDKLVNKASWAKTNEEYKRKMNEDAKSVEFETIEQNLTSTTTIAINSVSNSLSVEVEFEELTPVYRLYNMLTSEHMFTTNKAEYDGWVEKCKIDKDYWIGEGINWFAPSSQVSGTSTVRRLYNPALGAMGHSSHYYTSDQTEIDTLISQYGWQDDGVANQFISGGDVSIWTCYNEQLGSAHHYTSSKSEWEGLAAHGWDLETVKNGTTGVFKASMSAVS